MREEDTVCVGSDGLRYCKVCEEAKEAFFPEGVFMGMKKHSRQCACDRKAYEAEQKYFKDKEHRELVCRNTSICFDESRMEEWTFEKGKVDDKILFIDASKEFVKVTNNNRLTQENIQHIMDTYVQRTEIVHYAHVASHKEVVNNNYNLAVSTYVEEEDTREEIDIEDLENRIQDIVQQEDELRRDIESIIREIEGGTE